VPKLIFFIRVGYDEEFGQKTTTHKNIHKKSPDISARA